MLVRDWYTSHQLFQTNICWLEMIKKIIFWSEVGTLYILNRLFPKERNMLVRDCYIVLLTQA